VVQRFTLLLVDAAGSPGTYLVIVGVSMKRTCGNGLLLFELSLPV
jgi:hypothetical protein